MTMPNPMIPFRKPVEPKKEPTELDKALEAIKQLTTTVTTLAGEVRSLKEQRVAPVAPQPKAPAKDPMAEEYVDPTEDDLSNQPIEAIKRIALKAIEDRMAAAQPAVDSAFNANIELAKQNLRARDPMLYDFVKDDFEKFIGNIQPQVLTHKFEDGGTGLENAFAQVVGKNHKRILENINKLQPKERERTPVPFTEHGGPRETPALEADDRLSAAEQEVARTMGISADEYLSAKRTSVITTPDLGGIGRG